ncbi:MAG: TrbI/VirB10 family protein [Deltaproteobacteria bacterium]|nr:TrbI/VirB10 family protein [Deltaproteobacteria bacterium]
MMEQEAKIASANAAKKRNLVFRTWDRTKYSFSRQRVWLAVIIFFTAFTSYTVICAMTQMDLQHRSEMVPAILYLIPDMVSAVPRQNLAETTKTRKPITYSGPQVIYRAMTGIPPGTLAKARLVTGASDGPVRAEVLQDVIVNGERVIEAGAQLLGNGNSTEERLILRFEKLVKRDGTILTIGAQALDGIDQIAGIKGNRVGNEAMKLAAGIGLNFVGGLSDALQETEVKGGVAVRKNTVNNALLNGTTHAALDQSKDLMTGLREKAPRIEVEKGRKFQVMFDGSGG